MATFKNLADLNASLLATPPVGSFANLDALNASLSATPPVSTIPSPQPTVVEEPSPVEEKGFLESLAGVLTPGRRPKRFEEMTPEERRIAEGLPGQISPRWPQTEGITPARIGRTYENIEGGGEMASGLWELMKSPIEKGWGTEEEPGPFRLMKELAVPSSGEVPFSPLIEGGLRAGARGFFGPEAEKFVQEKMIGGRPTPRSILAQEMLTPTADIAGGLAGGDIEPLLKRVEKEPLQTGVSVAATLAGVGGIPIAAKIGRGGLGLIEKVGGVVKSGIKTGTEAVTGVGRRAFDISEDVGRIQAKKTLRQSLTAAEEETLKQYNRGLDIGDVAPYTKEAATEGTKEVGRGLKQLGLEIADVAIKKLPEMANKAWKKSRAGWELFDPKNPVSLNTIRADINNILQKQGIKIRGWATGKTELDFSGITGLVKGEQTFLRNAVEEVDKLSKIDPGDFTTMHQQLRLLRKLKDKAVREGFGDTERLMKNIHSSYRSELGRKIKGFDEGQKAFETSMDLAEDVLRDFVEVTSSKAKKRALTTASNKTISRINNVLSGRMEDNARLATLRTLKDVTGIDFEAASAGLQVALKSPKGITKFVGRAKTGAVSAMQLYGYHAMNTLGLDIMTTGAAMATGGLVLRLLGNVTIKNPNVMGKFFRAMGATKEVADQAARGTAQLKNLFPGKPERFFDTLTLSAAIEEASKQIKGAQQRRPSGPDLLTNLGRAAGSRYEGQSTQIMQ